MINDPPPRSTRHAEDLTSYADYYGIKRNNFHNVPENMPESARFNTPALTRPEQYFIGDDDG